MSLIRSEDDEPEFWECAVEDRERTDKNFECWVCNCEITFPCINPSMSCSPFVLMHPGCAAQVAASINKDLHDYLGQVNRPLDILKIPNRPQVKRDGVF